MPRTRPTPPREVVTSRPRPSVRANEVDELRNGRPNPLKDPRIAESTMFVGPKYDLTFFPGESEEYKGWREGVRTPRRYVAVELELGGIRRKDQVWRLKKVCEKWFCSTVPDGSLPSTGFELNTQPAKGRFFEEQITDICKALKSTQAWVNVTCGLHVHVDCRDLSPAQILRLVEVYALIEDGLFLVVPESRRNNAKFSGSGSDYCAKCAKKLTDTISRYLKTPDKTFFWGTDPENIKKKNKDRTRKLLPMAVYEGQGGKTLRDRYLDPAKTSVATRAQIINNSLNAVIAQHYSTARYWALNLHPYFYRPVLERYATTEINGRSFPINQLKRDEQYRHRKRRGTIECRLAGGTIDPVKILMWARLWDQIVHVAISWPTDRIKSLSKDSFLALLAVADDTVLQKWLNERKAKFAEHEAPPEEEW